MSGTIKDKTALEVLGQKFPAGDNPDRLLHEAGINGRAACERGDYDEALVWFIVADQCSDEKERQHNLPFWLKAARMNHHHALAVHLGSRIDQGKAPHERKSS